MRLSTERNRNLLIASSRRKMMDHYLTSGKHMLRKCTCVYGVHTSKIGGALTVCREQRAAHYILVAVE